MRVVGDSCQVGPVTAALYLASTKMNSSESGVLPRESYPVVVIGGLSTEKKRALGISQCIMPAHSLLVLHMRVILNSPEKLARVPEFKCASSREDFNYPRVAVQHASFSIPGHCYSKAFTAEQSLSGSDAF